MRTVLPHKHYSEDCKVTQEDLDLEKGFMDNWLRTTACHIRAHVAVC